MAWFYLCLVSAHYKNVKMMMMTMHTGSVRSSTGVASSLDHCDRSEKVIRTGAGCFMAYFLQNMSVKEFWKSWKLTKYNIWRWQRVDKSMVSLFSDSKYTLGVCLILSFHLWAQSVKNLQNNFMQVVGRHLDNKQLTRFLRWSRHRIRDVFFVPLLVMWTALVIGQISMLCYRLTLSNKNTPWILMPCCSATVKNKNYLLSSKQLYCIYIYSVLYWGLLLTKSYWS